MAIQFQIWKTPIWSLKKASLILIVLPYLGFNWQELLASPFYSNKAFAGLLAMLIGIELMFKIITYYFSRFEKQLSIFFTTITFLFFYGNYLVEMIFAFLSKQLDIIIRGRIIFLALFVIIALVQYFLVKQRVSYRILNVFLLVFGAVTFISKHNPNQVNVKPIENTISHYKKIQAKEKIDKPIILLIADEYNSPDSLYKYTKDSSIYGFSDSLKKQNWIVHNSSYSYETSTIHSVASLFNFNLSLDSDYAKQSLEKIAAHKLSKAAIYDSLIKKQVDIINLGIFDLNKQKPFTQLYIYPKSFSEQFLLFTAYTLAKNKTQSFKVKDFDNSYYPVEAHNKFILNHLADTVAHLNNNKSFIYAHLFMPHAPLQYEPEYKKREITGLADYIDYWRFTNKKLNQILTKLTSENKYRIILTGDHGYRGDGRINKHQTFTAYYGFDSAAINQVESVQDLGSLINGAF